MPTTLDWLNIIVLEDLHGVSHYPPEACTMALDHLTQIKPPASL